MKVRRLIEWSGVAVLIMVLTGCAQPVVSPATLPTESAAPMPTAAASPRLQSSASPTKRPLTVAPSSTAAAAAISNSANAAGPSWWASDLPMPPGIAYQGESDSDKPIPARIARWLTQDPDLDALRDRLVKQGRDAGYTVVVLEKMNNGASYNISLLKGTQAFQLVLLKLGTTTHVDGHARPTFQFKTTRAVAQTVVLPMGNWSVQSDASMRLATPGTKPATLAAPSQSLNLIASQPNEGCVGCRTAISLTIAAYQGPGTYSAADVQVNPGGDGTTGNYRHPTRCTIVVKDEFNGTFECQGLENQADQTKTIDLKGTWQAPVF